MKTIKIIIEKSSDFFDGYAENFPGISGAGSSVTEVKNEIMRCVSLLQEQHPELANCTFVYKYDM